MQFYDNFLEGMWKLWYVWVIIKNNTLYLYVSSVFNMEDKTHELILNLHKKEPTKVIHYSVAPIPQHQAIWRDMKEFTPVTKHSFAPSGTSNVQYQAIWRDMKEPTLVINHSAALRVTKNVQHQALWRDLKGTTAAINHSVAPSVTTTVQYQSI